MIKQREKTIAELLDGKKVMEPTEFEIGQYQYDVKTLIYTFKDGSQAKQLIRREPCEPYIAASTTTMSSVPVNYWMVV